MMRRFGISTFVMTVVGLVATLMGAPTARAQVVYQYDSGVFSEFINNSEGTEFEDNFVGNYFPVVAGGTRLLSFDLGVGRNVAPNTPVSLVIYDGYTLTRIHTTETTVTGAEGTIVNLPLDNPVDLNEGDAFLAAVLMRDVGPGDIVFPFLNDTLAPHGFSYFDVGPKQGAPYDLDDLGNLTVFGDTHPVVGAGVQDPGDLILRVRADVSK